MSEPLAIQGMGVGFTPIELPKKQTPVIGYVPIGSPKENRQTEAIKRSPNRYVSYNSDQLDIEGAARTEGIVDVVSLGPVKVFCAPSKEARDLHSGSLGFGQDAAAVVLVDGQYLMIEADGVSNAYQSEIAARESTGSIVASPSTNLQINLSTAETFLKQIRLSEPSSGIPMVDDALRKTRDSDGSETMFNQLSIDAKTGQVNGLFLGDGGFTVLKANGQRFHYPPTDQIESESVINRVSRLSTKRGIRGNTRKLKDIVNEIVLSPGDSILLYSDALQHTIGGDLLINSVCDIFTTGQDFELKLAKMFEGKGNLDTNDDDKTLLVYTHK